MPENTKEIDFTILENAHKYRLHQDLLRWSLLAGYGIAFSAIVSLTSQSQVSGVDSFLMFAGVAILGTAWLFGLGAEHWFYNLFGLYVQNCERRMRSGEPLEFLFEFTAAHAREVTLYHASYYWALLGVSVANCYFVWNAVFALRKLWPWTYNTFHIVLYATCILYFMAINLLLRNWNKWVYKAILCRMQNLFEHN